MPSIGSRRDAASSVSRTKRARRHGGRLHALLPAAHLRGPTMRPTRWRLNTLCQCVNEAVAGLAGLGSWGVARHGHSLSLSVPAWYADAGGMKQSSAVRMNQSRAVCIGGSGSRLRWLPASAERSQRPDWLAQGCKYCKQIAGPIEGKGVFKVGDASVLSTKVAIVCYGHTDGSRAADLKLSCQKQGLSLNQTCCACQRENIAQLHLCTARLAVKA